MDLDITIHRGQADRPVVIFIHGLGIDKTFWTDPLGTKIFARNIPLRVFAAARPKPSLIKSGEKLTIGRVPEKINTLWTILREKGFNIICWSQRRPAGPINIAVEELDEVVGMAKGIFPERPIAIIGHSRGGLIARKFMEQRVSGIKALITLSTPHAGSSLSRIAKYISPVSPVLRRLLPGHTHGTVSEVMKNVHDLLQGSALKELMPGSDFFKRLKDVPSEGVRYLSFGGKKTELLTVYKWKKKEDKWCPKPLLTIPDSLIKIIPAPVLPDELTPGIGDFMVTAESSVMPWSARHYDVTANHISIIWNRKVIRIISEALQEL